MGALLLRNIWGKKWFSQATKIQNGTCDGGERGRAPGMVEEVATLPEDTEHFSGQGQMG